MRLELAGSVTLSLSLDELRRLREAISGQALNPRDDRDRAVTELFRAIEEFLNGKRDSTGRLS